MVYPDIMSAKNPPSNQHYQFHLAPVADRFLAFVIDAFLFGAVINFLVAGQLKEVRSYAIQNENSPETLIIWLMFVGSIILLSIFIQSLCTFFLSGTPGQRILKLRVVSMTYDNFEKDFYPIQFLQALLRSSLWWLSLPFMGWPFLEAMSHPQRRCFHDRASDTMVVSLIANSDLGPSRLEKKLVSSWLRLIFFSFLMMLGLYSMKVHQMVRSGYFSREDYNNKGYLCELSTSESLSASKRLDMLLAIHILDPNDEDCLGSESDLALWNQDEFDKPMGYLVKFYLEIDKDKKSEYQKVLCEKHPNHEACQLSKFILATEMVSESTKELNKEIGEESLRKKGLSLLTSRVFLLDKSLKNKNFILSAALMEDLLKDKVLEPYLQKNYVSLAWQIQNQSLSNKRSPASDELQTVLKEFKKRFEIP